MILSSCSVVPNQWRQAIKTGNSCMPKMAEKRKENNIMTVELAIQRETTFQRRLAMLKLQPNLDSGKDFMPSQLQVDFSSPSPIPSSSPRLSGIKRKAPTYTHGWLPQDTQPQSVDSIIDEPTEIENPADNLFCKVCNVPCSSAFNYKQHVNGKKHMAKLHELKLKSVKKDDDDTLIKIANQRQWCGLCEIWCMDEATMKQNLGVQKHQDELKRLELGGGGVREESSKSGVTFVKFGATMKVCLSST